MKPFIIGIAGGSGSGKTTLSRAILEHVGNDEVVYIQHDAYYHDLSNISFTERVQVNYDHPTSLENELLITHLNMLLENKTIEKPIYDFKTHTRSPFTQTTHPKPVIILEGILIFSDPELRDLLDLKIFVDTPADVRILRRLKRDIEKRGRSAESVIEQYFQTVRPMHIRYVEPTRSFADIILPEGGLNKNGVDMIVQKVFAIIRASNDH